MGGGVVVPQAAGGIHHQPQMPIVSAGPRPTSNIYSVSPTNVLSQHRPMLSDASSAQHRPMLMPPMQMQPCLDVVPVCQPSTLPPTTTTTSPHLWSQAYHYYSEPSFSMSFPSSSHFLPISSTTSSFSGSVSNHSLPPSMPRYPLPASYPSSNFFKVSKPSSWFSAN